MNAIAGSLLYVLPEIDAFFTLNVLLTRHCPGYITPNLDGVHVGCDLFIRCLELIDPEVHHHLFKTKKEERMEVMKSMFVLPHILSMFACREPLNQVLMLWDALFAFGIHLNIILCVVQVIIVRDNVLAEKNSPLNCLRMKELPPIDAEVLISGAFQILPYLSPDLFDEITIHPFVTNRGGQEPPKMVRTNSH